MADKLRTQQQLESLQNKYIGTGHADTTKHEWTSNIARDSYASFQGHPPLLHYMAIGMGMPMEKRIDVRILLAGEKGRTPGARQYEERSAGQKMPLQPVEMEIARRKCETDWQPWPLKARQKPCEQCDIGQFAEVQFARVGECVRAMALDLPLSFSEQWEAGGTRHSEFGIVSHIH
ncbi:unnamed protein product [Zymoseptoria tritici ST99CH_3D7]|uniref:Splicing factor subunit n=2 Tax=Zymoseptoria tritici TaxID=1047171 RepID=A0A1X7RED2_ZYMT9|nr:unnamed protein product [Zymoseptoria tritici ST99CH_3D7]SMR42124.1 unnamed protein product [Zymoseptoria tritici ST99CH_1E4]